MEAAVQHPFSVMLVRCSEDGAMCARTCALFSSNCSVRHFCRLTSGVLSDALGSRPGENSSCSDWTNDATSSRCFHGHRVTTFRTLGHHCFQLFWVDCPCSRWCHADLSRQGVLDLGHSAARRLRESHTVFLIDGHVGNTEMGHLSVNDVGLAIESESMMCMIFVS